MPRKADLTHWQVWVTVLVIALAFFGYLAFDGNVFYGGDIARLYLPEQQALGTALEAGELPWWSTLIGAGYPLIGQGESSALYPINLLLHALLSAEVALTVSVLLHLFLAGLGMGVLARTLGLSRGAALFSGVAYALGGFLVAHVGHVSIIAVSAWFPWLLREIHQALRAGTRRARVLHSAALAGVVALQFLAGHAQISLLILLPGAAWAVYVALTDSERHRAASSLLWPAVGVLLGTVLALPQLVASLTLAGLSQRAGGLDSSYFTSFSFHPYLMATFLSPFLRGNPYPEGSIELMGYIGLAPLVLGWMALARGKGTLRWFLAGLAALGLFLAIGRYNPLYSLLERIPPFNLFRVPARYLLWTSLSLPLLGGMGLDWLQSRERRPRWAGVAAAVVAAALAGLTAILARRADDADALVALWRWFPLVYAAAIALWLLAASALSRRALISCALFILCADLYSYGAVLNATYTTSWPLAQVREDPALLDVLPDDGQLYRVWTKESILPILSVQRESLYPNIAGMYGVAGASIYSPLIPRAYESYTRDLTTARLNRLNVRYYVIPQLLPVDEASELYDVQNPYSALPYGVEESIDLRDVVRVQVESYVSHAADVPTGELAGTVVLGERSGEAIELPLRVGIDTAEWAIERSDVALTAAHTIAPIATSFPASSSYRSEEHTGHTYLADFALDGTMDLTSLTIVPSMPEAYLRIDRIRFITSDGAEHLASHLLGLGDWEIVYRSEDALVYENQDVWPRAYTVSLDQAAIADGAATLAAGLTADALGRVTVSAYESQHVELSTDAPAECLLVLADMTYPGWRATVDGMPAEIITVDGLFRGVLLTAGPHTVVFDYHPWSLALH